MDGADKKVTTTRDDDGMDAAVRDYIEAIPAERRPLFDRVHCLIGEAHPDVTIRMAYKMPTYCVGERCLHLASWKHDLRCTGGRLAATTASRRATPS